MNEVQQALERLLGQSPAQSKVRRVSADAEAEAAELYEVARNLQQLRRLRAPDRLRERGLEYVFAPRAPRRHLWLVPSPATRREWGRAASRVAASVAVAAFLGFGTVRAAGDSLPDSPLYPVRV